MSTWMKSDIKTVSCLELVPCTNQIDQVFQVLTLNGNDNDIVSSVPF